MEPLRFIYTPTKAEIARVVRSYNNQTKFFNLLIILVLFAGFTWLQLANLFQDGKPGFSLSYIIVFNMGFLTVFMPFGGYLSRNAHSTGEPIEWEINEDGIEIKNLSGSHMMYWQSFDPIYEDNQYYYLTRLRNKHMPVFIPKQAIADQNCEQTVRHLLESKIGKIRQLDRVRLAVLIQWAYVGLYALYMILLYIVRYLLPNG